MEYYFVLSFREMFSDDSGYNVHIIPVIDSPNHCIFECYGAYFYNNGKKDIFKFSYDISCIDSLIQQMKMIFNMWKSNLTVELHQMKLHKKEPLDFFKIESNIHVKDQIWSYYNINNMKNKTCKKILKSVVNA